MGIGKPSAGGFLSGSGCGDGAEHFGGVRVRDLVLPIGREREREAVLLLELEVSLHAVGRDA
jgi:hypothetical protein